MKLSTAFLTLSLLYRCDGQVSCSSTLLESVSITPTLTMYWESAPDNSRMICVRIESESESWIGLGTSQTGGMVGSEAVIGLPNEGTVSKYMLNGQTIDEVVEMDGDAQNLVATSVVQEDGKTTVSFATSIAELVNATMIYAVGSSNDLGYHSERGSFSLDLGTLDGVVTSSTPSAVEETSTSSAATTLILATSTDASLSAADASDIPAVDELLTVVPTTAAPIMSTASIASPTYSPTVPDAEPTYPPTPSPSVFADAELTYSPTPGETTESDEITGSPSADDTTPSSNASDFATTPSPSVTSVPESLDGTTSPTVDSTSESTVSSTSNPTSNSTDSATESDAGNDSNSSPEFKSPVAEGASKEISGALSSSYQVAFMCVTMLVVVFGH
jgi:hypothetical protein